MILDFQSNTCCLAVYKPYKMLEMVIALVIETMCITLTLKQGVLAFVGKKAYLSQQVKQKP